MHEFDIIDTQALKEWERLMGFKIHGNTVKTTHDFYVENCRVIHAIQMSATFRLKLHREGVSDG